MEIFELPIIQERAKAIASPFNALVSNKNFIDICGFGASPLMGEAERSSDEGE